MSSAQLCILYFLLILRVFLEQMAEQPSGEIPSDIFNVALALVGILLLQRLLSIVSDTGNSILRQESWVKISEAVMAKLPNVPYEFFEDNNFQAEYGITIRESAFRLFSLVEALTSTGMNLIAVISIAAILFLTAPILTLLLLSVSVPAILIESRFSRASLALQAATSPDLLRIQLLSSWQIDALWQRDLRTYHSSVLHDEYVELTNRYLNKLKRLTWRFQRARFFAATIEIIGIAFALIIALESLASGRLSFVDLGILVPSLFLLISNTQVFSFQLRSLTEALGYAAKLFQFLEMPFAEAKQSSLEKPEETESSIQEININSVTYTYPNSPAPALDAVTCTFERGITAIVGPNSSGKSTLVKLLSDLIVPTSGAITAIVDSGEVYPLQKIPKATLFQDPSHFYLTVRQIVTMQHTDNFDSEERVKGALQAAGLLEFVTALPQGIDTVVGAGFGGATDLSGGQWQRLALARLLYHDSPILILDEPNASLDFEGEKSIFANFDELAKEKIVVFTTHRYDTIKHANKIVILNNGKIEDVGTHAELLSRASANWYLLMYHAKSVSTGET